MQRSSPLEFELVWEATVPVSGTSGYVYIGINQPAPPPGNPVANRAVFTPAIGLEDGAYLASVAGPMDEYDNVLVPYSWTFRADSTRPRVEETVPAANARDGYPDEPVVAWLDEPFPVLAASALVVRGSGGETIPGTLTALTRSGSGFSRGPTGIQFTPQAQFDAPGMYEATVGCVTDYCDHPVVTYTWSFEMACLFADATWDEAIDIVSCNGQQFELSTDKIEGASVYEWQVSVDGGMPETTITGMQFVMDTPLPDQAATVRVRGRDEQGCITAATA